MKRDWKKISEQLEHAFKEEHEADKSYFTKYVRRALRKKDKYLESVSLFGTPQYILDEEELEKRVKLFTDSFSKSIPTMDFFYPFKCNDLPYLISIMKNLGFNADVAGLYELELALKMGFEKIIFSSPGKDEQELKLAIKHRDKVIISVDNVDEYEKLKDLVKNGDLVKISFRINPGERAAPWTKFGLTIEELKKVTAEKHPNLKWIGLHFHTSWNNTPETYVANIQVIGDYLKSNNITDLEFVDIGGGFYPEAEGMLLKSTVKGKLIALLEHAEIPHNMEFDETDYVVEDPAAISTFVREIASAVKTHVFSINKETRIYTEPGRFITKHSTKVLTKVLYLKEGGCIVDAGTTTLVGENPFVEYEYAPIVNLSNSGVQENKTYIYGPLCDPYDIWGFRYYGTKIQRGDILAVLNQGAYTFSFAQRFIKPTAPYIVLTKNGEFVCARDRGNYSDRYGKCKMF